MGVRTLALSGAEVFHSSRVTAAPNGYSYTYSGTSSEPMSAVLGFLHKAAGPKSPPPLPPSRRTTDELQIVAKGTISRTPEITAVTPGASADSIFHVQQLPPLRKDTCPNFPQFTVRVEGLDVFTTSAERLEGYTL